MNKLPEPVRSERRRATWRRRALWSMLAALLVALLLMLVWLAGRYEASQLQSRLDRDAAAGRDEPSRAFNSTLVFTPQGHCVAHYDKIHLFRFDNGQEQYDEARTLRPGRQPVTFDLPSRDGHRWRIGLSVCYDLRFPELYRRMGSVDVILVPSAFTATTGRAHWETLLRARAVENQAYVLAPAQGGRHPSGRETHGDTMIVDPWGDVLTRLPTGPGIVVADIDPARIATVRASLPALEHRTLGPI